MKKLLLLLFVLVCFTQLIFSQGRTIAPVAKPVQPQTPVSTPSKASQGTHEDVSTWRYKTLKFDDARNSLGFDTALLSNGPLQVVVTSNKTDQFKFTKDKFPVTSFRDFNIEYAVKPDFKAGHATMTLYMYSGKLMVFKKTYSVMFDSGLNPIITQN